VPNLINTCDRRNRSTTAPQALLPMNNNLVITQAKFSAERVRKEAGANRPAQIDEVFLLALGRLPSQCQAMFSLYEFAYRQ
jgi:hypothetical protein